MRLAAALQTDHETDSDELIVPNEIFSMIVEHLGPGTRSLLKLARTCRALYDLLLPRLYETFSLYNIRMKAQPSTYRRPPSVPSGMGFVKRLDLAYANWDNRDYQSFVEQCSNSVQELSCNLRTLVNEISK